MIFCDCLDSPRLLAKQAIQLSVQAQAVEYPCTIDAVSPKARTLSERGGLNAKLAGGSAVDFFCLWSGFLSLLSAVSIWFVMGVGGLVIRLVDWGSAGVGMWGVNLNSRDLLSSVHSITQ